MLIRYFLHSKEILQVATLYRINKIIIFGSSVTSACNPWSDIDIYIDFGENTPEYLE